MGIIFTLGADVLSFICEKWADWSWYLKTLTIFFTSRYKWIETSSILHLPQVIYWKVTNIHDLKLVANNCTFTFRRPRIDATLYAIKNGTEFIWSNKTVEWTYKYFIFAVDGGTPKRGDRIPLTITFNATCQESGGIVVNATSGEVSFRAPGMTGSEYRESLTKLWDSFSLEQFSIECRKIK